MCGCGCNEPKEKATYVCTTCGKEEIKDDQGTCCDVKSCCGQPMKKKD